MSVEKIKLKHPPIIEAVLDIDCDMPVNFSLEDNISNIRELYKDRYPDAKNTYVQHHAIKRKSGKDVEVSASTQKIQALQLRQDDGKQLVQVRSQGYSFNRLAPYTSLDDYLEEIQRTWLLFPLSALLFAPEKSCPAGWPFRTKIELAVCLLKRLHLCQRAIAVVDNLYAKAQLLLDGLRANDVLVSRLRSNAALYDPPKPRNVDHYQCK